MYYMLVSKRRKAQTKRFADFICHQCKRICYPHFQFLNVRNFSPKENGMLIYHDSTKILWIFHDFLLSFHEWSFQRSENVLFTLRYIYDVHVQNLVFENIISLYSHIVCLLEKKNTSSWSLIDCIKHLRNATPK